MPPGHSVLPIILIIPTGHGRLNHHQEKLRIFADNVCSEEKGETSVHVLGQDLSFVQTRILSGAETSTSRKHLKIYAGYRTDYT